MGRGYWAGAMEAVREYPTNKEKLESLHSQKVTASITGMPGGGEASRTTENVAIKELPPAKQKDYDAVRLAIEQTLREKNGKEVMKLIRMKYWQRQRLTLASVAMRLHCSEATARRWHGDFIRLVLKNRGLRD